MINSKPRFVFFGTPEPAEEILNELKTRGLVPNLIVTNPDKIVGRKQILTSSPVKKWALENNIPILQPENLDSKFVSELKENNWDLFIVVAYGKIIPKELLEIPKFGSINVHYSLLPKYRGASPVESQILNDDKETGVSIILIDEKMDHGPILAQAPVNITNWPPTSQILRSKSNKIAGEILAQIIPKYISGKIIPKEQDHSKATYTKKFLTEDGLINLDDDPYKNYLKIQAFSNWLPVYFFIEHHGKKIRVKITEAEFADGELCLKKVIPEGKKEMDFESFKRGYK
ncbi:MAG: methionyl-tRNA formyltransferase [bacterium]